MGDALSILLLLLLLLLLHRNGALPSKVSNLGVNAMVTAARADKKSTVEILERFA